MSGAALEQVNRHLEEARLDRAAALAAKSNRVVNRSSSNMGAQPVLVSSPSRGGASGLMAGAASADDLEEEDWLYPKG